MNNKKPKDKYPLGYNYAQNVDTSDMPDSIHYFLVLPLSASAAKYQKNYKSTIPIILTYENQDWTFENLLDEFKKQNSAFKNKKILFTTQKYENIDHSLTVKFYKAMVNSKNINGSILCINQQGQKKQVLPFYVNECSVNDYNKKLLKQNKLNLRCQIPIKDPLVIISKDGKKQVKYQQKKIYIFVDIGLGAYGVNLEDQLIKKLNSEFQKDLKTQQVKQVTIDGKVKLDEELTLKEQFITKDSRIVLYLKNNEIKLSRKKNINCKRQLIIFKEGCQDSELFQYEQVWQMTFEQLYQSCLKLKDAEQKVDTLYCLKIMDLIIQPQDSMNKIDHYFAYLQEAIPATFVGKVINQKMVFYKMIPEISQGKPFSVNQLNIPEQQQSKRQQFRQIVRSKAKNARHIPLKSQQNLEPIMLYTSDLKYIDQQNQEKVIYSSLNSFLRDSRVLSIQSKDYQIDWRFRYSSILLKQLKHIQRFKGTVYRGLSYDPKASKGNILTFKQFTSTSKQYSRAKFFADLKQRPERVIYQMKIESGFPIRQYSHYAYEDEVLLQPFTDFLVTDIKDKTQNKIKYKIYYLQQIRTPKQFPIVCANFIVWIDNTVNEGQRIFQYLAFSQTTLLIQLKSTAELKKWLENHKELLSDKTANIVFLTNMTRKQQNGMDEYAGANAIKQLRKYTQRVPVCVYIGNLPLANKKLAESNINQTNILVTADSNQVVGFLLDHLIAIKN